MADFVRVFKEAEVDATSLSNFMIQPATVKVPRRLAPAIDTLEYYLEYLRGIEKVYSQTTGTVTVNGTTLKTMGNIITAANNATNAAIGSTDAAVLAVQQSVANADALIAGNTLNATNAVNDAIEGIAIDANLVTDALIKTVPMTGVTGAVARNQASKNSDTVTLKDFGAKGDDVTDDTAAIQAALDYIFIKGGELNADGGKYAINSTLIIPQNTLAPTFVTAKSIKLDFKGAVFNMLADVTLFKSSNWGTTLDSAYSFGITLTNFGIESAVGVLEQPSLLLQDWHQRCEITNITSQVSKTVLISENCYYAKFDNINTGLVSPKGSWTGSRFIWRGDTNLCQISRLVAVNSNIGYQFDGSITALVLRDMSFEGMNISAQFNSEVYDLGVTDSYCEAVYDVMFQFNTYVHSATFTNNYINMLNEPNAYFLQYAPLPAINIMIDESNHFISMVSDRNIIKNKEDVYGHGIVVKKATKAFSSNIDDFKVSGANFGANIDVQQKVSMNGVIANVTNGLITGNYSGKFSNGYGNANGFKWLNTTSTLLAIDTKILTNFVQLVYVNLEVKVVGGATRYFTGFFIGNNYFKADNTLGIVNSTELAASTVAGGFLHIECTSYLSANITAVTGEIRLI